MTEQLKHTHTHSHIHTHTHTHRHTWNNTHAAAAKSLQSCPTLCDPIDGSPLGSPVPGILQARTLEWVAISFSNAWKWKVKGKSLSRVRLFATPWTAAYQTPPSMRFSRQESWSGVPLPSPGTTHKSLEKSDGIGEFRNLRQSCIWGQFPAVIAWQLSWTWLFPRAHSVASRCIRTYFS